MIRKSYSLLILWAILSLHIQAQSIDHKDISFDWSTKRIFPEPTSPEVMTVYTISDGYLSERHPEIPGYAEQIPISGPYEVEIYAAPIETSDVIIRTDEAKAYIQSELNVWHKIEKKRNQYYLHYGFIPVIASNDRYQKVDRARIQITLGAQKSTLRGGPTFASSSKLSEGDIYKVAIERSGVYRMSYDYLKNLGVDVDNINPKNLSIYSSHGRALAENLNEDRSDDLTEIAIHVVGEGDGSFDTGDYVLFYAEGSESWSHDGASYVYHKNIYDDLNYAFIKVTAQAGKRIQSEAFNGSPVYTTSIYHDAQRYEEDKVNLLGAFAQTQGTGQLWFGDRFNTVREYNYTDEFDLSGYISGEQLEINLGFAARTTNTSRVYLDIDGVTLDEAITSISNSKPSTNTYARYDRLEESIELNNINTPIIVRYPYQANSSSGESEGWIDYLQIIIPKSLSYSGNSILVSNQNTLEHSSATLNYTGTPDRIWDVTDIYQIQSYAADKGSIQYETDGELKFFYLFDDSNALEPEAVGRIENQNLHAQGAIDMLVIYHPEFESSIDRYLEHRRTHSQLNVAAVSIDQVYQEYSNGRVDPTAIRDLNKMLYDRYDNYRYLLLVGDGSYDYKQIMPNQVDHNFIPVYETKESFNPVRGFPTDDYYALLDINEGTSLIGQLDIAVGRIPVKTSAEFAAIVDKMIHYETQYDTYGDWRLRLGFAADDEDNNLHLSQTERIAKRTAEKYPDFNQQKIYFDAFVQESTPGGARYPEANKAINNNIFQGMLVLNYLGHGGPKGWSQERVLQVSDVQGWDNYDKMPLLITATCSFTGYDEPSVESAGEISYVNPKGGAIALFSTTRAVFAADNERLVTEVYDTIFSTVNGSYQTLGDIITNSKNNNAQDTLRVNARKFTLIGDPAMKLSVPDLEVRTLTINEEPIVSFSDTLRALDKVTITGVVTHQSGSVASDYNGLVYPTIYDKQSQLRTLKNDEDSEFRDYQVFKNIIFKGAATVTNGMFSYSFVVPKDIDYSFDVGRISYYAQNESLIDAGGHTDSIMIGGASNTVISDNEGPVIEIFMNDESWVYGGITDPDPVLLLKLQDENGINVTGTSIGHDLSGKLDDDQQGTFIMNDYYEAEVDDFTRGSARYPLSELTPGRHSIDVKAWDVLNNSSEARAEFLVVQDGDAVLERVLNYPNPFTTSTHFQFEHDLVDTDLDILVSIYTISGKVIKTIETTKYASGYRIDDIHWDGKDDFGSDIGKGVYLYKIKARSDELNLIRESDFQKLVILH